MPTPSFRDYLFAPDHPRVAEIRGLNARDYAEAAKTDSFAGPMIEGWQKLYPQPFTGITSDGVRRGGLFPLAAARPGEEAPTADMVAAARKLLGTLTPEQARKLSYAVDAPEWQSWANPEFMQHDTGLRLDELGGPARDAILGVVEASLSGQGFELVRNLMRINGFLGELVELPLLMNEFSYNFALYGEPSETEPWGWQLFGHHAALNCLVAGTQLVISPVFMGAEPDMIDAGPHRGVKVFKERIALARQLMGALPAELRSRAVSYGAMVDPAMPEGRIHPGDERHLGGCFQDNRVIPYEGILVADMPAEARELLDAVVDDFIGYLPDGPRAARRREIQEQYGETYFSWIGGWEGEDAFYLRLQSPVVVLELDHHTGVFLSNDEPAPFHMHTVVRTPNGNDYGRELVRQATP
ncbi:conserved hypothetical protein [Pseudarthrobacter chlorophenolicus A6]|uniref:DUF3500 domain-containing protein n=1 Tax=Pseudarthrobacter chlorophenolicus (strain ATCC 700700 / DSM 12829 / CIP 107037 / JCM 12360 / KCTC 9906 / NCIMB 13794 / A6) TaxID=452863 RepID=B8HAJ0_PSECP|nr:DUF3500 domain-containing protein [Pseudarthrobacter chlorophenolicus]ACL38451.1 conserved hypothetical protein [Pseudarthrobacter chlorophenolicus A6]SDQ48565.1 Protein of unknown function [Pseudarthrobacter chlorophenolicus]